MQEAVVVLLLLAPVAAGLVVGVRMVTSRRWSRAVGRWVQAATCCLLASVAMYGWGSWKMFAWDIRETCSLVHHQRWDPAYGQSRSFPLSRRCNASFDLVPSYVNPAVVVLLAAAVLCAGLAVRAARRHRTVPAVPPA